ncbi:putative O-methyltransferase [Pleomassaria siparia CBS 279.74]|uniref:Putative O-methyltransferase n=1 Tax=Pleomassaria siparia CBS 279.74 TaxID=1314801 RepID=A0A6G1KD87_9PLEO|nr:putative O-methyltransferase [Pleomassaria siparia CBS 279.74]
METTRIAELARIIASQTDKLDKHLRSNNLPEPSFSPEAPVDPFQSSTSDIKQANISAVEAAIELRQLLEGPVKLLVPESNFAPLAAIRRFKIASHVPKQGGISFADLASMCGLLEHDLRRVIRYAAIHHRVFCEPEKGFVAHTAASKLLAENGKIGNMMDLTFSECWPAHSRAVDAMAQKSEEPNKSGYSLANGTSLNMFEFLAQHPDRARRFAGAMSSTTPASLEALVNYFDWSSLPDGSTVVDVGGARGHVSIHLAKRFPHLRFVVEDMPEVVEAADREIPEDLKGRVSFVGHNMFIEQPVKDAHVYLFRYVLHDWPDKYCVKILQQLIPAMKEGAMVVTQDHLLPEPGTLPLLREMQLRSMDANMMSLFNSRERAIEDWRAIFEAASVKFSGFSATRVKENPSTGVIQLKWTDKGHL